MPNRYFLQGAVDIFNCLEVAVYNCVFEDNGPVTINKLIPMRGHSAGLSVAYFILQQRNETKLTALIRDNTFRNNSAHPLPSTRRTSSQLLAAILLTGRGGACAVNVYSVVKVDVIITGCTFQRNFALTLGGAMYYLSIPTFNHSTILRNCAFIENKSPGGGGGLQIGYSFPGSKETASKFIASNLRFIGNTANFSGGINVKLPCEFHGDWQPKNHLDSRIWLS